MILDFEILDLETRHPFRIARPGAQARRRTVWIRLTDAVGVEGWGEAAANNYYGETVDTVSAVLPRLAEALEESSLSDPFALERIELALEQAVSRNPAARAAISMALHDMVGKRLSLPVWKLWGLSPASAPLSSFTLGIDEPLIQLTDASVKFLLLTSKLRQLRKQLLIFGTQIVDAAGVALSFRLQTLYFSLEHLFLLAQLS